MQGRCIKVGQYEINLFQSGYLATVASQTEKVWVGPSRPAAREDQLEVEPGAAVAAALAPAAAPG